MRVAVGQTVRIQSMNLNTSAIVVSIERQMVTLRTIHGKVVATHIRNIKPLRSK